MKKRKVTSILKEIEDIRRLLQPDERKEYNSMSIEQRHRRIAELVYMNGSYNGFEFKSPQEYDSMIHADQSQYIDEVSKIMMPWVEEAKKAHNL